MLILCLRSASKGAKKLWLRNGKKGMETRVGKVDSIEEECAFFFIYQTANYAEAKSRVYNHSLNTKHKT